MVSSYNVGIEAFALAALVSFFTTGISAAARPGALLFPIKYWMDKQLKDLMVRKRVLDTYRNARRSKRQPSFWMDNAFDLLTFKIFYRNWWHKMVLTCSQCMPTLYTTIIYWSIFYQYDFSPVSWVLAIPIASTFNLLLSKRLYS